MSSNNIVLIGFMGSGKSTIGRLLAKEINYYFLDTDNLIETFENKKISDIFAENGENYFRQLEQNTVEWISNNVKNSVISTGGGMAIYSKNIKKMGKIIYLKVDFEEIYDRLSEEEIKKRPLFKDKDTAYKLFTQREKVYENLADKIIENKNIKLTIENIINF